MSKLKEYYNIRKTPDKTKEVPTELLKTMRDVLCSHVVLRRANQKQVDALDEIDKILEIKDHEI